MTEMPEDPITQLGAAIAQWEELREELLSHGFTRQEAQRLLEIIVASTMMNHRPY